jgi:CDP-paratose 2-epimerase
MTRSILVTGSSGLIGSEVVAFFADHGWKVHGLDNNMRANFFGPSGDTRWNQKRLADRFVSFEHHELDLRNRVGIDDLVANLRPSAIVHCAAQPSHDLAASRPFEDFDTNAVGTLNVIEAARRHCPESPFVHMSTNKVYGDAPNSISLVELKSRWEFENPAFKNGISEKFPIDQSKHSLFGASKVAADILVQEYGRYFGMPTCCLRGGCLTGPNHSGVELHGFLSFLVQCNIEGRTYRVLGYKGKQVRDNIHSLDVARFIHSFVEAPRSAEVYNIGGGRANSISIIEAFDAIAKISGKPMRFEYVDEPRIGDHICYISDLAKMQSHYPRWGITKNLSTTLMEIYEERMRRRQPA